MKLNPATPSPGMPAELPRRFLAFLIDAMVIIPIVLVIVSLLGLKDQAAIFGELFIRGTYIVLCLSGSWQATVGMRIVNLYVTDLYGARLTPMEAAERYLAWLLPLLPIISSLPESAKMVAFSWAITFWYVPALVTKQKTAIHDILSRSRVLQRSNGEGK